MTANAILLVSCADRPGIVATIARFVADHGGNIVDLQQHTDRSDSLFFQRVEFELAGFDIPREELGAALRPTLDGFSMHGQLRFSDDSPRTAILASRQAHCLYDLLSRWRAGELSFDVKAVISNHPDHAEMVGWFGVPYHYLPIGEEGRVVQESSVLSVLEQADVELVVLARYMQVLSPQLVVHWPNQIINIHHSFLPAFQGGRPYHQAHERGVKIIGVTAHYVTAELDGGPIIDQDVVRVSHRDDVELLEAKGRDLEVSVLARAVRAHLEHRVLVHGNRTIVFER